MKEYKSESRNFIDGHTSYRDPRLSVEVLAEHSNISTAEAEQKYRTPVRNAEPMLLTRPREGDSCPECKQGKIKLKQAVEIGHTFHLGTRYSVPLEAHVLDANNKQVPIEMGCHGIGVSRLIGAIAALLADSKGLNWPLAIAPYDVVIVFADKAGDTDAESIYDLISRDSDGRGSLDAIIDDRSQLLGWKLNDADLIGYPLIVVLGNAWRKRHMVELQCRRLGLKEEVSADDLVERIREYSKQLLA